MARLRITGTTAITLALLAGAWSSADAQTTPRIAVSVDGSADLRGPSPHLEDTLRAAGLADVSSFGGGFFGTESVAHPFTDRGLTWGLDLRMRVRPRVSVGLNLARSNDGATYGYEGASFLESLNFSSEYSMETVAPVITWHPTPRLRVGAGPALQRLRYVSPEGNVSLRRNTVGVLAQAGLMFWDGKSWFSELTGQYRGVGALDVPDVTLSAEPFMREGPPHTVVIPANDVPFQNWSLGVSLGFRLR